MPPETADDPQLRAVNARIAGAYDRVPYDPVAIPGIDPVRVFGLAALYGVAPPGPDYDVFDLGCGTGAQLRRVAAQTRGRLLGVDLSRSACDLARERAQDLGPRCEIRCADFLDLDAADLGQFDLIYNVGVLYITPPEVQRRILDVVAGCLKPNGLAVISYYFGTAPVLTAGLQPMLRLAVDPASLPAEQVRVARRCLQDMANGLSRQSGDHRTMLAVLQQAFARDDSILFHELLNHRFEAISTASLETALGTRGVHFLNMMTPGLPGIIASPRERALALDGADLAGGGYHYAVFAKNPARQPANPRAAQIEWETALARTDRTDKGLPVFSDSGRSLSVAANPVIEAALDALANATMGWTALNAAVEQRLEARGMSVHNTAEILDQELVLLWQHGLATPLCKVAG